MRSLDHSMIFLLIAGTYTAFGVLALSGLWRLAILAVVWAGAGVGIGLKLFRIHGLGPIGGALYIALGWTATVALPQVSKQVEPLPLLLIVAGGVLYTTGSVVLFLRRPNPSPLVFGYHEVWHSFVVLASLCHYAAIMLMLRSTA
jgi:hemolysin III